MIVEHFIPKSDVDDMNIRDYVMSLSVTPLNEVKITIK